MLDFKIYGITDWTTDNYNTHIAQCSQCAAMKCSQLIEYNMRNTFLQKS